MPEELETPGAEDDVSEEEQDLEGLDTKTSKEKPEKDTEKEEEPDPDESEEEEGEEQEEEEGEDQEDDQEQEDKPVYNTKDFNEAVNKKAQSLKDKELKSVYADNKALKARVTELEDKEDAKANDILFAEEAEAHDEESAIIQYQTLFPSSP